MEDTNTDQNDGTNESLGARLRKAREYKGLDKDSVAHQLNLNPQRIDDMENDDYRFAVAESYAKGYLRMYAKLVGLDPDLTILEFDRMKYSNNIQHHRTKLIMKRQISSGDGWMRWLTYTIGMVLVILVAIWWRNQPSHSDAIVAATETSDQTTTDITTQTAPKKETSEHSLSQSIGEDSGLLQKPDLSSTQQSQDPLQDLNKTQNTDALRSTNQQTTDSSVTQSNTSQTTNGSVSATTATPNNSASKNQGSTAVETAKATQPQNSTSTTKSNAQSSDEDDSEEEEEEYEDDSTGNVQGLNLFKKKLKPKVFLGQREHDEQALLHELDKVLGRG